MGIDNRLYFFFGDGMGEYVLNPIYREMKNKGYDCVELTLNDDNPNKKVVEEIKNRDVVFVTSAHLFLDKINMDIENRLHDDMISSLEIIDYLKPVKKVYYPHDLLDSFNHYDRLHFSLFDVYLSPLPVNAHGARFCDIIDIGWIKKVKPTPKYAIGDKISFGHAFSEIPYYVRTGTDFFYSTYQSVWQEGVKVKLHNFHGTEMLQEILEANHIDSYNATANIYDLINDNPIVITNSVTGVNVEAALSGRMVINLLDGIHSESYQRSQIYGLPNTHILKMPDAVEMIRGIKSGKINIEVGEELMKLFDMDLAIKSIVG